MRKAKRTYREELRAALKDKAEALRYLNAALEHGDRKVFLLALRDVAEAHGGMSQVARLAGLNRENLYRMLSERGNPEFTGLGNLLGAMGFRLAVEASRAHRPAHA